MPPCASRQIRGPRPESASSGYSLSSIRSSPPPCPLSSSSSCRLFLPDREIISLKAHGGKGTTKEERLPYEATVYVPPRARPHPSLTPFSRSLSPSAASAVPDVPLARSFSHSLPRRRRGARARCVLSLCPPRARSVLRSLCLAPSICLSRSLLLFSSSYPLARAIYFVFVPTARPVARSLRSRLFGRHIDASGWGG